MADRIVQLEDNEGNKIYPISAFDESAVLIDTTSPESTPFDISTMGSYSLDEIETPFTWIDGKKIYKKTVHTGSVSPGDNDIPHNVTFNEVVKIESMAICSDGYVEMPFASKTRTTDNVEVKVTSSAVRLTTDMSSGWIRDSYVTFYYTK